MEAEGTALFTALSKWMENSGPLMAPDEEDSALVGTRQTLAGGRVSLAQIHLYLH